AGADPTRDIAFDIVQGVLEHRRMLETSLDQSLAARGADARDRAAAPPAGGAGGGARGPGGRGGGTGREKGAARAG
ncbi:MAG: hypothetical protein ABF893_06215, partial [Gluconacetobacter liquefaciens]